MVPPPNVDAAGALSSLASTYEAGTRPLSPSASCTLTQPEPSSSSRIWTIDPSVFSVRTVLLTKDSNSPTTLSSYGEDAVYSNKMIALRRNSSCTGGTANAEAVTGWVGVTVERSPVRDLMNATMLLTTGCTRRMRDYPRSRLPLPVCTRTIRRNLRVKG